MAWAAWAAWISEDAASASRKKRGQGRPLEVPRSDDRDGKAPRRRGAFFMARIRPRAIAPARPRIGAGAARVSPWRAAPGPLRRPENARAADSRAIRAWIAIDISRYATGTPHVIAFEYTYDGRGTTDGNLFIDDVTLDPMSASSAKAQASQPSARTR
ncbi:MAG TPA: hypothetical protein VGC30_13130 [Dokdonella sp.]